MSDETFRTANATISHHNNSSNASAAYNNKDYSVEFTAIEMIDKIKKRVLG